MWIRERPDRTDSRPRPPAQRFLLATFVALVVLMLAHWCTAAWTGYRIFHWFDILACFWSIWLLFGIALRRSWRWLLIGPLLLNLWWLLIVRDWLPWMRGCQTNLGGPTLSATVTDCFRDSCFADFSLAWWRTVELPLFDRQECDFAYLRNCNDAGFSRVAGAGTRVAFWIYDGEEVRCRGELSPRKGWLNW